VQSADQRHGEPVAVASGLHTVASFRHQRASRLP
jgi:hypothetical protein